MASKKDGTIIPSFFRRQITTVDWYLSYENKYVHVLQLGLFWTKGYYTDHAIKIQRKSRYFSRYLANEISEDELTVTNTNLIPRFLSF